MSKQGIALACALLLVAAAVVRADELVGDETQAALPHHWTSAQPVGRGAGPVTAQMLAAPNSDASRWLQYHGDSRSLRAAANRTASASRARLNASAAAK